MFICSVGKKYAGPSLNSLSQFSKNFRKSLYEIENINQQLQHQKRENYQGLVKLLHPQITNLNPTGKKLTFLQI